MNRKDEHADKGQATQQPGCDDSRKDDRWLSDLNNELSAISLSSDDTTDRRSDEMGFVDESKKTKKPSHEEVGI